MFYTLMETTYSRKHEKVILR